MSGMLQCVVNEPASDHEPRTELYMAVTLKQRHKTSNVQKHGWILYAGGKPKNVQNKGT